MNVYYNTNKIFNNMYDSAILIGHCVAYVRLMWLAEFVWCWWNNNRNAVFSSKEEFAEHNLLEIYRIFGMYDRRNMYGVLRSVNFNVVTPKQSFMCVLVWSVHGPCTFWHSLWWMFVYVCMTVYNAVVGPELFQNR